jgi:hypothetical protein
MASTQFLYGNFEKVSILWLGKSFKGHHYSKKMEDLFCMVLKTKKTTAQRPIQDSIEDFTGQVPGPRTVCYSSGPKTGIGPRILRLPFPENQNNMIFEIPFFQI